jgi:murein L,D-transpeptidase YcbB/YkuD
MPVESRIRAIQLNLERWRELAYAIPSTRFEVNVPAASARLIVDNQSVLEIRAVVGDPKHPTPMLASTITDVVINPYWTIPVSIIEDEIRPILKRDPGYLERNNMHWQNGNLVQDPGGKNPLGKIRFTFTNKFGVYVHDTSAPGLFANAERARSHGCLRIEKPVDLAAVLLAADPDWPREKIVQTISEGKTTRVALKTPMPVVIAYWTAFTDPDGTVEFRDDVYGRDERLAGALKQIREKHGLTGRLDANVYFAEGCGPS